MMSFLKGGESMLALKGHQGRINRAICGPLNKIIVSAGEDAVIHIWDSEQHSWTARYRDNGDYNG
ncbi:hypothetical protein NMG60_11033591 [Bertholletia excelsa]